jgi:multiple sugar transport system substrate-binding protein
MVPEWQQISIRVAEAAQQAVHRASTPERALRDLDRDVDQILEKRRWVLDRQRKSGAPKGGS